MTPDEVAKELLRLEADRSLTDAQFLVAAKKVVQDFLNPVRSSGGDCTASLRDIPGWKEFVERNVDRVLAVTPEQQRAARKLLIDKAPVAEITLVTGNQEREEAMLTYACAGCPRQVPEDDAVWVNPETGEATTGDGGRPYHVSCAPAQHNPLRPRLLEILGDRDGRGGWCGCYDGDMEGLFEPRRNKAVDEIEKLIKELLAQRSEIEG